MTPSERESEKDFADICKLSSKVDVEWNGKSVLESNYGAWEKGSVSVSPVEVLSNIDKRLAVEEGQREARTKLSYSLCCQNNGHHHCISMNCGCPCHGEKEHGISRTSNTSSGKGETTSPKSGHITDPYWESRLGKARGLAGAVGSTEPSHVGWRGSRNEPSGNEPLAQEEETLSLTIVHRAGEILSEKVEQAVNMLEMMKRDGRETSGEAKRLARFISSSFVEPSESNWKGACKAQGLAENALEKTKAIISPTRIQLTPFPSCREVFIVDDVGTAVRAFIPEEEVPLAK